VLGVGRAPFIDDYIVVDVILYRRSSFDHLGKSSTSGLVLYHDTAKIRRVEHPSSWAFSGY
jgi:hypothetical protein